LSVAICPSLGQQRPRSSVNPDSTPQRYPRPTPFTARRNLFARLWACCYYAGPKGGCMDTNRILDELKAERDRIDRAISAIEGLNSAGHGSASRAQRAARTRRTFSAATRARMAAAQRARWAKAKPAQASKPARRVSRAARKRMAAAQRARWAKVRAQKKAAA